MIIKRKTGFTLIELLIVIALIGILVGFSAINLVGVRGRARDGERKSDLRALQSAFELMRSDQGSYPAKAGVAGTFDGTRCKDPFAYGGSTYIKEMPCDPLGSDTHYIYTPSPASCSPAGTRCTSYELYACLENINDIQDRDGEDESGADKCKPITGRVSYTVSNP